MLDKGTMLYLYAETPFHPGASGAVGYVDLPVQRETHTGFPMFQASGLKGVLREKVESSDVDVRYAKCIFGPDKDGSEHAGCISVGDARILLFPVRSLKGVFAWVTCPMVLQRLMRDYKSCINEDVSLKTPAVNEGMVLVDVTSVLLAGKDIVVLEEYEFKAKTDAAVAILADWIAKHVMPLSPEYTDWNERLKPHLAIVSDDSFSTFVNFNTMIVNRTKLDNKTKTVIAGALWTEEHLPPDTVMYAPVYASMPRAEKEIPSDINTADGVLKWLAKKSGGRIIAGGDETVGRGILYTRFQGGDK